MRRLAIGLLVTVAVHISVVLLWPVFVVPLLAKPFGTKVALHEIRPLDSLEATSALRSAGDPLFKSFFCKLNDRVMPVAIKSSSPNVTFWTASIYDRSGVSMFSANSGLPARSLDLIAITATDVASSGVDLAKAAPEAMIAEIPAGEAFAVVRVFEPDQTWSRVGERFSNALICQPLAS